MKTPQLLLINKRKNSQLQPMPLMQSMAHCNKTQQNKIQWNNNITNQMWTQMVLRQQMAQLPLPQDQLMPMQIPAPINNKMTRRNSNNKCNHSNLTKRKRRSTNRKINLLVQILMTKTTTLMLLVIQQADQILMLICQTQINKKKSNKMTINYQINSTAPLFINKLMMSHLNKIKQQPHKWMLNHPNKN